MSNFYLYANSSTSVTIRPEYNFSDGMRKIESRYRSNTGPEYAFKWADYRQIKFELMYITSADATQINSWWLENTPLYFQQGADTPVQVRLVGDESPITKRSKPNTYLHEGEIILESF